MRTIAPCDTTDLPAIGEIINESAAAYRGVIPADRWHDPYMSMAELQSEIRKGVRFHGCRIDGVLVGVMGIQEVKDVTLIRHAYVRTARRRDGVGRELLASLQRISRRPILIGTWKAATWAVRFYEKNGFTLVSDAEKNRLLRIYWTVPDRQIEESVVLADSRGREKSAGAPTVPPFGVAPGGGGA